MQVHWHVYGTVFGVGFVGALAVGVAAPVITTWSPFSLCCYTVSAAIGVDPAAYPQEDTGVRTFLRPEKIQKKKIFTTFRV